MVGGVDADIDDVYFSARLRHLQYESYRGRSYAIRADRQPVRLPFSIWKVDDRAVWGGYRNHDAKQKEWQKRAGTSLAAECRALGIGPEWVRR